MRKPHEIREPLGLCRCRRASTCRQPVILPSRIIERGVHARLDFSNVAMSQKPFDRGIQRAGTDLNGSTTIGFDLLHDGVSVPVSIHEREEDVELDRRDGCGLNGAQVRLAHDYIV